MLANTWPPLAILISTTFCEVGAAVSESKVSDGVPFSFTFPFQGDLPCSNSGLLPFCFTTGLVVSSPSSVALESMLRAMEECLEAAYILGAPMGQYMS